MKNLDTIIALVCGALALALAPAPLRADGTCLSCHVSHVDARLRAPAHALEDDVHGRAEITCSDCHGGDPSEPSVRAHDLGAGFVGRPAPLGVTALCSRCHDGSDARAPAVVIEYRSGRHGRALAEGHVAATCTSCHGAHGVQRPSERDRDTPRELASGGSAERHRIASACMGCHSSPEVMRASGLPTDQASRWASSVHGRAVERGNAEAPDCASCHHPHDNAAGLAAVRSCGGCHEPLRAAFDRGPHRERFERLGFLDCAECHGNHGVEPASATMLVGLGAVCTRCHGRGQAAFETVQTIAAHAGALDRARAALPPDDPRRRAMIEALHALDAEGLASAIASVGELPEPPAVVDADEAAARRAGLPWPWLGVAGMAVAALVLLVRARRSE